MFLLERGTEEFFSTCVRDTNFIHGRIIVPLPDRKIVG